jgi:hypothetical protein
MPRELAEYLWKCLQTYFHHELSHVAHSDWYMCGGNCEDKTDETNCNECSGGWSVPNFEAITEYYFARKKR